MKILPLARQGFHFYCRMAKILLEIITFANKVTICYSVLVLARRILIRRYVYVQFQI